MKNLIVERKRFLAEASSVDVTFRGRVAQAEKKLAEAMIRYLLRRMKVSGVKKIQVKSVGGKHQVGAIDLKDNHGGVFTLSIDVSAHYPVLLRRLAHEMIHVNQISKGELAKKGSSIVWKGDVVTDVKSYGTKSVHDSMPFEKATRNSVKLADGFWRSPEFKQAVDSDPTLSFLAANDMFPSQE